MPAGVGFLAAAALVLQELRVALLAMCAGLAVVYDIEHLRRRRIKIRWRRGYQGVSSGLETALERREISLPPDEWQELSERARCSPAGRARGVLALA